ncbi:MAG: hypothetical protein NVSMB44_39810 [Ktedonobacteraceae bacterium]
MSDIKDVNGIQNEKKGQEAGDVLALQENVAPAPRRSRSALTGILIVLGAGVIGGGIGLLGGKVLKPFLNNVGNINLLWILLALGLILFAALLVHECGHLLSGRLIGFRFLLLIVGPLKVQRSQTGIQIGLNTSLALAGGLAACAPTDENNLARKMLIMTAGGPVASLLLTLVAAASAFGAGFPNRAGLAGALLLLTAVVSGILTIVTLIPTHVGGFVSDGARIQMLRKGGAAVERWCAQGLLQLAIIEGQLPREWSVTLLNMVMIQPDDSPEYALGCSFGYYHALDSGDVQGAQRYLEQMLAARMNVPALIRGGFALEASYFEACYQRNAAQARVWLAQARGGIIDRCTRLRVESAVLLAEGEREQARKSINEGLAQVKYATYAGTVRMEETWLTQLLEESEREENHERTAATNPWRAKEPG